MKRALRVGITGKIASGKSTVSNVFRSHDITVLDSDTIAKDLMEHGPDIRSGIIKLFGKSAYDGEQLNRPYLAEKIFTNRADRLKLEEIVHPAVSEYIVVQFLEAPPETVIGVESALILQTDLWALFDYILLVDASDGAVLKHGSASGKFSVEDVAARLHEQSYKDSFPSRADFVIANVGTIEQLNTKAALMATVLKAIAKRDLSEEPLQQHEEDGE